MGVLVFPASAGAVHPVAHVQDHRPAGLGAGQQSGKLFDLDQGRAVHRGHRQLKVLRSGDVVIAGSSSITGWRTSSMAVSSPSSSLTPAALAFSMTCSGREAPMIAADTLEFWSTQATASWAMESPASFASGASCWTAASTGSLSHAVSYTHLRAHETDSY